MELLYRINDISSVQPRQLSGQTELNLWFAAESQIELIQSNFRSPLLHEEICAVRGKTSGAYSTQITFQWTSAVQALSALLLKAAARNKLNPGLKTPLLEGGKGSMASSLDASLYKQTAWLDLFGASIKGDPLSRRILLRTNPGRRRSGPVMISLNHKLLPSGCIKVHVNSKHIAEGRALHQYALSIEDAWYAERGIRNPVCCLGVDHPLRIY